MTGRKEDGGTLAGGRPDLRSAWKASRGSEGDRPSTAPERPSGPAQLPGPGTRGRAARSPLPPLGPALLWSLEEEGEGSSMVSGGFLATAALLGRRGRARPAGPRHR